MNSEKGPCYYLNFNKFSEDIDLLEISFRSMSLPGEDNAMFTAYQSEMIRDHIILYGEEVFGTLDPNSSYDRLHRKI